MLYSEINEAQREKIISVVVSSDEVKEAISKVAATVAPAIQVIIGAVQEAIEEELKNYGKEKS
jgi:hypothetical protein